MEARHQFDPGRLSGYPRAEARFIADLARFQDQRYPRDEDFVDAIGVSLSLWRQTRTGRLPLGFKLLMAGADVVSHSVFEAARASLVERASTRAGRPRKDAA